MTPIEALERAMHFLDRGGADAFKVRAFARALATARQVGDPELIARAEAGTLTELAGIGDSIARVLTEIVRTGDSPYLAKLDADTLLVGTEDARTIRERLFTDLHCHTTWSDGGASLDAMVANAARIGHDRIVITDHSPRLTVAHGLSEERLVEQRTAIVDANTRLGNEGSTFTVLAGTEVDILEDGSLDLPDHVLAELDVVVASVHSKFRLERQQMTERLLLAVANPNVDVLGHCTNRIVLADGTVKRPGSVFDPDVVFAACARFDTAVEINCRPDRLDPPIDLLQIAMQHGCSFAINSDAHATGQLEWQILGCEIAAAAGIDTDRIINAKEPVAH
jgi:putative hydrolase